MVPILADPTPARTDPFSFLDPLVVVSAHERDRLDAGETIARTLSGTRDVIAVFAAVRVSITGDGFAAWMDRIEEFKKNGQILQIGRFSNPPRLEDLEALTFPEADLEDLRTCRVGKCRIKLTASEIADLQALAERDSSPPALQEGLRRVMFERLHAYRRGGHGALGQYADRSQPVSLAATCKTLLSQTSFLTRVVPDLVEYAEQWPQHTEGLPDGTHDYFYWAKEQYGGRPIVSVTHVFVRRGNGAEQPEVLVIGKQLFATHYIDGWLGITALVRDSSTGMAYVTYVHRSSVDLLRGFWGGLIRRVLQGRLRAEAPAILLGIRRRLEGQPAPLLPPSGGLLPALP